MRSLCVLLTLTLCAAALAQTPAKSPWTIRGHIAPDKVIVQSHRGAGDLAPENTIEAFELGWSLGTIPESDVRSTTDKVIVAFHDSDFSRVVKNLPPDLKGKGVEHVTWDQLARLDVGAWKGDQFQGRRVVKLSEAFAVMKGRPERWLYMDMKKVDLAQLASEVKQAGVGPQVILASTQYPVIREWKRLVPDGRTLLWMGGTEEALDKRMVELRKTKFADVTQLQIHVRMKTPLKEIRRDSVDPFTPTDAFLIRAGAELRQNGILFQVLPWGGATEQVYWKLLDLGVMSFATDHPKVTRSAIEAYCKN